ncbi:FecR family protein [Pseudopedobacter beijingensis]|uniref:FecR family protein n=1 Tax=Pseudopedobacter beijingensis TaxID=1207056 RepID=A0ABW4I8Q5_9SPHI
MKKADELLDRYHSGEATPEEKAIVESWYLKSKKGASDLKHEVLLEDYEKGRKRLHQQIGYQEKRIIKLWPRVAIAASLLMGLTIGFYFFNSKSNTEPAQEFVSGTSVKESSEVILTLANGKRINLNDDNVGQVAEEEGLNIKQTSDGQLIYTVIDGGKGDNQSNYNIIETPVGMQYTVILPDGSKIWLSSASKLRYPTHFSGKERKVELSGEAYFEVKSVYASAGKNASTKKVPFIVTSGNQTVEVLGTQFNISAYKDDAVIKTALLEGAVKVSLKDKKNISSEVFLKPGQMALNKLNNSALEINNVDVEDVLAWREGYFIFNNENIRDIMKKVSRWYGFEVEYQGDMSDVEFQGNYLRTRNLSNLLEMLEMTNKVKFKILQKNSLERRVLVIRKN